MIKQRFISAVMAAAVAVSSVTALSAGVAPSGSSPTADTAIRAMTPERSLQVGRPSATAHTISIRKVLPSQAGRR